MGKIRIYELAKELHQDSRTIINTLKNMDVSAANHMSSISDADAQRVRDQFTKKHDNKADTVQPKTEKAEAPKPVEKAAKKAPEQADRPKKTEEKNKNTKKSSDENQKAPAKDKGQEHSNDRRRSRKNGAGEVSASAAEPIADPVPAKSSRQNHKNNKNKNRFNEDEAENQFSKSHENKKDRNRSAKGNGKGKNKNNKNNKKKAAPKEVHEFAEVQHHVVMGETITVQNLAKQLGKKASEVIMKLMSMGVMASMNQEIDADTAAILADEYGATMEVKATKEEDLIAQIDQEDDPKSLVKRPPVVTIMGHVDHGKTSLLDQIRNTNVTSTEAGGITQSIGAYQVNVKGEKITFLDTPGHEAFTAMRARGAQVTDIAVLVVAADDGVMPQTIEAIDHAKAANVPIIVAINKIDKPGANPEEIKTELSQYGLIAEDWGGDTIMTPVSAKKNIGIGDLLEMILLVAEMEDLKANPNRSAKGKVIESKLDKNRGATATLLVQNGTLHSGDFIIVGTTQGRVRAMFDYKGKPINSAKPSTPVEILGLNDVPEAGDEFIVVANERLARQVAEQRSEEKHEKEIMHTKVSLEDLFNQIQQGDVKELNIVLKADTQGSIEAIRQSLEKLSTDEVRVKIIRTAVGGIRETDISLASASNAVVIGFNVRPDANAKHLAEQEQVDVKTYSIIYEAIDDVKAAMSGLLAPEIKENELGQAEIRSVIRVPKIGNIAGCYVTEGKVTRHCKIRVLREGIVIYDGDIASLKRFKDDVREVAEGYECGISLDRFNDFKEGDIFEAYELEEIKREL
jgi:translation initiation factor IF-2